jgi:signal transduction histidine kinase
MRVLDVLKRSIPARILAALLSIYAVTYGATALVVYSEVRASLLEAEAAALDQFASLKYEQLANFIAALATDLTAWAELDVMNDLVSGDIDKRITQTLEGLRRLYKLSGEIYAFDANGKLIATSSEEGATPLGARLPASWRRQERHLVFIDKASDPLTGQQIVALEIPVFGTFDRSYRIGTLILTCPWSSIEQVVLGLGHATILLERGQPARMLAAIPVEIAARPGFDLDAVARGRAEPGWIVGHSPRRDGLVEDWEIVTLQDTAAATRPLRRVALELLSLGMLLGIPIVLLGRWLSRRLTAPIADLTRVVGEIADAEKLAARVPITSSDELGSLARSFNRMTETLQRTTYEREQFVRELAALNEHLEGTVASRTEELRAAVEAQQRLIGDISHEIKSPLARLSVALGLARRSRQSARGKQFDRIEREVDNISELASELLSLAKLDAAAATPEFSDTDLTSLLEEIVADAVYEAPHRAADVILRKPESAAIVVGNRELLRRAIENVVRNAIFYTEAGTEIEVALLQKTPGIVSVVVRDQGPGVPEAALAHLFEPFYRVDEARARETGGTGVGLAICQRVVELHGGSVHARNNDPRGLIVEIELRAAPPQP